MRPLGRFDEEDVDDEPAAPLGSMREERDLRFTGDDVDATNAGFGELWRVLGAEPLAAGEAAAAAADPSASTGSLFDAEASPFC